MANAEWKDIKVDLTNGKLVEEAEKVQWQWVNSGDYIGIAVDGDGNVSRVSKDAASAKCQIKGKWHSNNYGWASLEIVVAVEGPVKITYGLGDFSGDVIVKDATNTEVASMNISGTTWTSSNTDRVKSCYYTGDATTLTITGGSYQTYFAIEETAYVPNNKTLTFDKGDTGADGVVPATVVQDIKISDSFTIPTNFTLYKEGYTLTGWNDGSSTYSLGATYTITNDVSFTPVFTANTVSLNDRTSAISVVWDFQRQNGAPSVSYQNQTGIWVAQATVAGQTIDVAMPFDTNNGGKFANGSWSDWAQLNGGTKFTIPAAKGMTVTLSCYNAKSETTEPTTTTTFAGSTDYTTSGRNAIYTYSGSASTIDIVIGDGSYFKSITAVYPAPQTVNVTISDKLFATYYNSELALTVPANLQAATVDGESSGALTLNYRYSEGDVIPAGTPVLLKATAAGTYTLTEKIGDATAAPAGNLLKGSDAAATTTGGAKYYALQNGDNGIGFYWMVADGAAFTSGAHKAWLALPAAVGAPFFTLEGGTTGINQVNGEGLKAQGEYYNLAGQRVAQPTKGLYIVGGKKVIVK